jgi:hypothetical protein
MDYTFKKRDLRVKKDVSDLKLDPLFWGHVLGKTIFSQAVELIYPQQFRRCVGRCCGNYKVKAFSCWDQFLCMAFAQLTFRGSLRDIEDCLSESSDQLSHMGFPQPCVSQALTSLALLDHNAPTVGDRLCLGARRWKP